MKIAITATQKDINSMMDPRFGRAAYFLIVDTDTMEYKVIENKQNINLPQGAGIQAGRTIMDAGAEALITGNCGPKAFRVLESAGIKIFLGPKGKIRDIIEKFKNGELTAANSANVDGHWV